MLPLTPTCELVLAPSLLGYDHKLIQTEACIWAEGLDDCCKHRQACGSKDIFGALMCLCSMEIHTLCVHCNASASLLSSVAGLSLQSLHIV